MFSRLWKAGTDSALVTSVRGSEFQMSCAATLKGRDAITNLDRGMMRSLLSAERRFQVGT